MMSYVKWEKNGSILKNKNEDRYKTICCLIDEYDKYYMITYNSYDKCSLEIYEHGKITKRIFLENNRILFVKYRIVKISDIEINLQIENRLYYKILYLDERYQMLHNLNFSLKDLKKYDCEIQFSDEKNDYILKLIKVNNIEFGIYEKDPYESINYPEGVITMKDFIDYIRKKNIIGFQCFLDVSIKGKRFKYSINYHTKCHVAFYYHDDIFMMLFFMKDSAKSYIVFRSHKIIEIQMDRIIHEDNCIIKDDDKDINIKINQNNGDLLVIHENGKIIKYENRMLRYKIFLSLASFIEFGYLDVSQRFINDSNYLNVVRFIEIIKKLHYDVIELICYFAMKMKK